MYGDIPQHAANLSASYRPAAIYYEEADSVEYVRADRPAVYRRIDGYLTLIFDMSDRSKLLGFRLKGFKNFYLSHLASMRDFVTLVGALERAVTEAGNYAFDADERRNAYNLAREIALEDKVALRDLPYVALRA